MHRKNVWAIKLKSSTKLENEFPRNTVAAFENNIKGRALEMPFKFLPTKLNCGINLNGFGQWCKLNLVQFLEELESFCINSQKAFLVSNGEFYRGYLLWIRLQKLFFLVFNLWNESFRLSSAEAYEICCYEKSSEKSLKRILFNKIYINCN